MKFGDLLLIKSKFDPVGWIIRRYTHCEYNHVTWVINNQEIIDLKGRGVFVTNPNRYFNRFFYKTKILRLKNITVSNLYNSLHCALYSQTKGNYFKLWITYFLILLNSSKKHPRLTCSGFIATCLARFGFYFTKTKKPKYITPSDIEKSGNVYEINLHSN